MQSKCWSVMYALANCGLILALVATVAVPTRSAGSSRPFFHSSKQLVSGIEMANSELQNLKRQFMEQATDGYLRIKLSERVGFEGARKDRFRFALANVLMGEEFATILIKHHIIVRRMYAGLKLAFFKFLPMRVLLQLVQDKSFDWLKNQEQINVRPKFPGAKEKDLAALYTLIELRAKVRASEDVVALTSDNVRRVLQVAQEHFGPKRRYVIPEARNKKAMASHAKLVLEFYLHEVLEWNEEVRETYEKAWQNAARLAELVGGDKELLDFVDRVVDVEALDIDLNQQAKSFDYPPTITEKMIVTTQDTVIPKFVLKSLADDRALLLANHNQVHPMLKIPEDSEVDLHEWTADMLNQLCSII